MIHVGDRVRVVRTKEDDEQQRGERRGTVVSVKSVMGTKGCAYRCAVQLCGYVQEFPADQLIVEK